MGVLGRIIKGTTSYLYTQNITALGFVDSEKNIFLCFCYSVSGAIFDPKDIMGRIYKGNYYQLLYTKYESSGLCGFREDFFMFLLKTPMVGPFLTPRA